jgi:hypothetical protein
MDPFLLQTIRLSSDYDAVHFGGDLGCEEDENTWNGSPNLDWSLNVGKWFLNLAAFKEHTEECALEQGWEALGFCICSERLAIGKFRWQTPPQNMPVNARNLSLPGPAPGLHPASFGGVKTA